MVWSKFLAFSKRSFFSVFEGVIQSFVLTMLTATYLAMGTYEEEDDEHIVADQQEVSL